MPANNRLKLTARLFLAERPQLKRGVRRTEGECMPIRSHLHVHCGISPLSFGLQWRRGESRKRGDVGNRGTYRDEQRDKCNESTDSD
jgi:hypothetical protein